MSAPTETPASGRALADTEIESAKLALRIGDGVAYGKHRRKADQLRARADELERGRPREQPQITAGSRVRVRRDADYEFGGREGAVNRIEAHRSKTGFIVQFTPYRCMWFTADELELLPEQPLHSMTDDQKEIERLKDQLAALKITYRKDIEEVTCERDALRAE